MSVYDAATLAAFNTTAEKLITDRAECVAADEEHRRSYVPQVYNEAKQRYEQQVDRSCLCRMCPSDNPPDALCRLCGKVAYSGPHSVTERMCARCGYYCAECTQRFPEHMVPEEFMFLVCVPCTVQMQASR
jgi:hypothetical protein